MVEFSEETVRCKIELQSPSVGAIAFAVGLCGICLGVICLRLGPLARQAVIWNGCVQTTQEFLSALPDFSTTDVGDLQAMAVNLCNGSTPQKVDTL